MKFLSWAKDGGPSSPVEGFFLIEIKPIFSVVLLKFNKGGREDYHTHAFNALTWFISGDLYEEDFNGPTKKYKKSFIPKVTLRSKNHRVRATKTSWCLSIRGPWVDTWTEHRQGNCVTLTHGRKEKE